MPSAEEGKPPTTITPESFVAPARWKFVPAPERLYHYTGPPGVLGIATSRTIRMTLIHFLNDAREFQHGLDLITAAAEARLQQVTGEPQRILLQSVGTDLSSVSRIPVGVFSLSAEADLLSQWRAYCPRTGGYAVTFDGERLDKLATQRGFALLPCMYERGEQKHFAQDIVTGALGELDQKLFANVEPAAAVDQVRSKLVNDSFWIAAILKHPAFREEREWRLVSNVLKPTDLEYHAGRSILTPFHSFELAKDGERMPIRGAVVGPSANQELASHGIRNLLGDATLSGVPYREL